MQFQLELNIPPFQRQIEYTDEILLIGSCFTEHIADRLIQHKFKLLSNPHGILFNPLSVAHSLNSYIDNKIYTEQDLFQLNELWNSWDHHTRFSNIDKQAALNAINQSQAASHNVIKKAGWVIITLGSAFQYYLVDQNRPVANNHRAPAQWFEKKLLTIDEIEKGLSHTLDKLIALNPGVNIMFTISPVRHIRDGVIENNSSKARLIEAVHELCSKYNNGCYFPAYELVIDILRDYRFYDIDFVHPNYMATSFVWEQFLKACMSNGTINIMQEVQDIMTARNHRPRFPQTAAHQKFLADYAKKTEALIKRFPYLDMNDEMAWFRKAEY